MVLVAASVDTSRSPQNEQTMESVREFIGKHQPLVVAVFERQARIRRSVFRRCAHRYRRIGEALACEYGYAHGEAMLDDLIGNRHSLVENKIVEMPHTRLLMIGVCGIGLINLKRILKAEHETQGTSDSIFPVEDNCLTKPYGGPKEEPQDFALLQCQKLYHLSTNL